MLRYISSFLIYLTSMWRLPGFSLIMRIFYFSVFTIVLMAVLKSLLLISTTGISQDWTFKKLSFLLKIGVIFLAFCMLSNYRSYLTYYK